MFTKLKNDNYTRYILLIIWPETYQIRDISLFLSLYTITELALDNADTRY